MRGSYHQSILSQEVLAHLKVHKGYWYLDCTLGDGGHSLGIIAQGGNVIGIDQDEEAIKRTQLRFESQNISPDRYRLINSNFRTVNKLDLNEVRGVVMDLGVSSYQLDTPERGFSFRSEAILDMRMDKSLGVRAVDLINALNKKELERLFWEYGDFRNPRIVEAIIRQRSVNPIKTTTDLAQLVERYSKRDNKGIHPATTIFQALRIAVNDELGSLEEGLDGCLKLLENGGSIVVITFHSLEDRIVKRRFVTWSNEGMGEVVTKKPILPSVEELEDNPRARSSKLRVFKKYD